ncbi:uncharacterized protein LOC126896335 [Daktulosphaira vitifoliae]|uniref:uncharacterized protein LOC126896335 n=1 Tax=Daktulosphaira vitifoliae TaxID=58002 RepID=UPI0021AA878D|nr:uncharacterized protein LOC126896335 [Daktulosphaira vitifoliae]
MKVITLSFFLVSLSIANAGVIAYPTHTIIAGPPAAVIAPAPALVRTPSLDSAVVHSERVGGNFAYSTVEGHAYTALNPVIQHVNAPVAITYRSQPVVAPVSVVASHPLLPAAAVYAPAKTIYYTH